VVQFQTNGIPPVRQINKAMLRHFTAKL